MRLLYMKDSGVGFSSYFNHLNAKNIPVFGIMLSMETHIVNSE